MISRIIQISTFLLYFLALPLFVYAQSNTDESISLLFVGDIMGHTPQIRSAEVKKNRLYNYKPCFEYVAPIIRQADLAIGNLEVTLPGEPPYRGYPIFRSPDDLARDLKWAGFDLLVTANNHANDGRKKGVLHTIETLRKLGIHQTGTFNNKKEKALLYPLIVQKKGFKLAFLNYTYSTNNIATTPPTIVNSLNRYSMERDIAKAKKQQPDAIILIVHWGDEYQLIENENQRKLAAWLSEKGVDIIIGAHPHVVQPITTITKNKRTNQQKTLVAYSLGNFISNQDQPHTDGGIMLEIELRKSAATKKTSIHQTRFIPIWRYIQKSSKKDTYQVLPIAAIESTNSRFRLPANDRAAMKSFARTTRNRLRHNGASEKRVTWSEIVGKQRSKKQISFKN